jgi:hypothetical protein
MKKHPKKLSLNRETVLNLEGNDIRMVAGGGNETSALCFQATGCECASQGGWDCYPHSACLGTCSC